MFQPSALGLTLLGLAFAVAAQVPIPTVTTQVVAGVVHSCALTTGGAVWCWGRNAEGQLGDGTNTDRAAPVQVSGLSGVVAIALYGEDTASTGGHTGGHTCALTQAGAMKCWGSNSHGQLGQGTSGSLTNTNTPVDVPGHASDIAAIAVGARHTCSLSIAGAVRCWGDNDKGQLGDNSRATQLSPKFLDDLSTGVVAIVAGFRNSCAILQSGEAKCWGDNNQGQVGNGVIGGDGASGGALRPQTVTGLGGAATAIAIGSEHACAIVGGGAKCWGDNFRGQLGRADGDTADSLTPNDVFGLTSGAAKISAGIRHTCVVTTSGTGKCWGDNDHGQAGPGSTVSTRPLSTDAFGGDISGLASGVLELSGGYQHTCAVTIDGSVRCWGSNVDGRIGHGATLPGSDVFMPVTPTNLRATIPTSVVGAGRRHSCARTTSGGAMCWGRNVEGQLGNGAALPGPAAVATPVPVSGLSNVVALATGGAHSCALETGGAVRCWGSNSAGQLGRSGSGSATPVDVTGLSSGVVEIVAGDSHTCARMDAGGVKCWGSNSRGQLGHNVDTGGQESSPVDVHTSASDSTALSGATAIGTGENHTCAIVTTGTKCWGHNNAGQLGTGAKTSTGNEGISTPVDVAGAGGTIDAIAGGAEHTCVKVGSNAKCWGTGGSGQIGNNAFADALAPQTVRDSPLVLMGDVVAIAAGSNHACARLSTGGMKCWGLNDQGQLGDGTTTNSALARAVRGFNASAVAATASAGWKHTCAVDNAGIARCWGEGADGQIGDNALTDRTSPADVLAGSQSLVFTAPASLKYATPAALSATALSGLGSGFDSWTPGTCGVSGAIVTPTEIGLCGLRAKQAGDGSFRAAPQQLRLVVVGKADQAIVISPIADRQFNDPPVSLSTAQQGGSGNPVVFSSLTPSVCSVSGSSAALLAVGTCTVQADQAGNTRYNAGQATLSFSVLQDEQTITFGPAPSPSYVPGGQFSVSATASSGLAVTISVPVTTSVCTFASGHTLNIVASGTCTVQAQQPGNANYSAAPAAMQHVTIAKANQAIGFGAVGAKTFGDAPFTVSATGGASGNPVVLSQLSPAVCTLSGNQVTIESAGSCVVGADQAGNANYNAGHAELTVAIAKAGQAITGFGTLATRTFGEAPFSVAGGVSGGASGNPVHFVVTTTTTVCTTTLAGQVTLVGAGSCTVEARQDGNGNYLAAAGVPQTFTVQKAGQAIAGFGTLPGRTFGDAPFTVAGGVTGGASGNAVYFVVPSTTAVCTTTSAGTVTIVRAGTCTIEARQDGNANYNAAPSVSRSFAVNAIAPTAPVIGMATPGNTQATINFSAPTSDGGAAVTAYNATCNPGANTASGPASPVVVTGLANGVTYSCSVTATNAQGLTGPPSASASVTPRVLQLIFDPASVDFGGQSMGTNAPASSVTVTNDTLSSVTIASVSAGAQFPLTHNCATVAPQQTCTVQVAFLPANASIGLTQSTPVSGTLTVASSASGSPHTMPLAGSAEKSLVTHYYRSILRRAPDSGGKAFWSAEATRVAGLGASVNETWFAMAQTFYFSAEYGAFGRNNTAYVTDLYATFFNRAPDSGGLNFWVSNLDQGMPREVALASFMFSTEFVNFTTAIFGNVAARAEVNTVVDFYRGLLARTPDDGGFTHWRDRFRTAQCQGQSQVVAEVESISRLFTTSAEYTARNRTNAQYVGDLYNAFLRRGGDQGGVQYWIGTLNSNSLNREQVRVEFKNSAEFQARVQAIIQQGCPP